MCPFRAIRRDALAKLDMREETYGWNLEMQMKAARAGLRILEIPVNHRRRAGGESKVSGTLRGTFVAGTRIIATCCGWHSRQEWRPLADNVDSGVLRSSVVPLV